MKNRNGNRLPVPGVNVPLSQNLKDDLSRAADVAGEMPIAALARIFIAQGIARWRATGKLELIVDAA